MTLSALSRARAALDRPASLLVALGFLATACAGYAAPGAAQPTVAVAPVTQEVVSSPFVLPTLAGRGGSADERPNVVFITADDMRLDDMDYMPHTRKLLGGHGVTFTRSIAPHPLCCPSRAQWMTGQFGHNSGVHHNQGEHGGFPALINPNNNLGAWLAASGYETAMSGKYMNGYSDRTAYQMPGWTHWNPSVKGIYSYMRTTFQNDGDPVKHRNEQVDDVVTGYTQQYVREFAGKGRPFFVWASDLAPHTASGRKGWGPPVPAKRHRDVLKRAQSPALDVPSYGRRIVGGPASPERKQSNHGNLFRQRIRALQAVDEGVRDIVRTLKATGELDNTYIFFTSDNGYLLGEHQMWGKNRVQREVIEVPLLVRIPHETKDRVNVPVSHVDFAATVLDLANATSGRVMDGTSYLPLLRGQEMKWRETQLLEIGADQTQDNWGTHGVRTTRWTYAYSHISGKEQLYDRRYDPYEMVNLAEDPTYSQVRVTLRGRTDFLRECVAEQCSRDFSPLPSLGLSGGRAGVEKSREATVLPQARGPETVAEQ